MGNENLEKLLDLIADALIQSEYVDTTKVNNSQKFIRDGLIKSGPGDGTLALFQRDVKANEEDVINSTTVETTDGTIQQNLQEIANNLQFYLNTNTLSINVSADGNISISGGGDYNGLDITSLLTEVSTSEDGTSTVLNPLNVSQFIPLEQKQSIVDVTKANEFLDTNIFELLPTGDTRQSRIIRFFNEMNALLPPIEPEFDLDGDGRVDRNLDTNEWTGSLQYQQDNSIAYAQDNPNDTNIGEEDAFIHRIKNLPQQHVNANRTIQDIYNRVLPYLTDILEDEALPQDERPVYRNQSKGYLQFRNPNQGIIIRNTNEGFVEGLDPNNLTYLNTDGTGGFTITMWVRFLDKVSEGTLFNFGNPTREVNPFGFKLETFVIESDKLRYDIPGDGNFPPTYGEYVNGNFNGSEYSRNRGIFQNSNTARFVRLQVREFGDSSTATDIGLRDSHLGAPGNRKFSWDAPDLNNQGPDEDRILNYTFIPEDFNEWYFICASYNPNVIEPLPTQYDGENFGDYYSSVYEDYKFNSDFWLNHINPNDTDNPFTNFSGFGNKCKVEIISKSDLLRARGFKV
tara:strand:- start:3155 stop:4867 length:1713 start_codon:yes stop_codon:yes gene_type:complete